MSGTYISMISLWINRNIIYKFSCEHCGKQDISVIHSIFCRTVLNGAKIPDTEKEREEVPYNIGSRTIKSWVIKSQTKAVKGDFSFLKGKCPHCYKYQTWAMIPKSNSGILVYSMAKSIAPALIGALICAGALALIGIKNAGLLQKSGTFIFAGILGFAVFGLFSFFKKFNKLSLKYKQYNDDIKDVKEKHKPEIDWNEEMKPVPVSKSDVDAKNLETTLKKDRIEDNMTIIYNTDYSEDIS